jgi:hypothetical protein
MQKMKIKKYISFAVITSVISLGLASCLKETVKPPLYGWPTSDVISFQDNGGVSGGGAGYGSTTNPYPSYNFSFKLQNDTAGFNAIVIYGPVNPAPEDITINVKVDTTALNVFNNANSTSYVAPDSTTYSFPSSVVIPKGQSQAYVHVTIKATASFDFNASNALPLTITSASSGTVSPNFGSELNIFGVENMYDGAYTLNLKTTGWAAYGISDNDPGVFPADMDMVTAGANGVSFYSSTSGANMPALTANNAGGTGFGATTPVITFDPATNKILSVNNSTPDDGRGRTLYLNPAVTDSRYDPTSKTIYAAYIMTQNGRPLQYVYDTLMYKGSR